MKQHDENILFSRTIKAGSRIYYIDVKKNKFDEFYLQVTESKRLKPGNEDEKPVLERHKIFVNQEDLERFLYALEESSNFVRMQRCEDKGPTNDAGEDLPTNYDLGF